MCSIEHPIKFKVNDFKHTTSLQAIALVKISYKTEIRFKKVVVKPKLKEEYVKKLSILITPNDEASTNPKMKQIILEDHNPQRGFLSALNLTLLSIFYLQKRDIQAFIGQSILSSYAHLLDKRLCKTRPFSSFFGNYRHTSEPSKLEIVYIDKLWLTIIEEVDWQSKIIITELNKINQALVQSTPAKVNQYTNKIPPSWPSIYDLAIHYRGCDYLANVPLHHKQNFDKETFLMQCMPFIEDSRSIFVATDDDSFVQFLEKQGLQFFAFKDVKRGKPGRGVHTISKWQKFGIELPQKPFLRGIQVLRDCTHLSRAKKYIGTNSNLMYYSSVLNPEIKLVNLSEASN
jgi:hypothetical protein